MKITRISFINPTKSYYKKFKELKRCGSTKETREEPTMGKMYHNKLKRSHQMVTKDRLDTTNSSNRCCLITTWLTKTELWLVQAKGLYKGPMVLTNLLIRMIDRPLQSRPWIHLLTRMVISLINETCFPLVWVMLLKLLGWIQTRWRTVVKKCQIVMTTNIKTNRLVTSTSMASSKRVHKKESTTQINHHINLHSP